MSSFGPVRLSLGALLLSRICHCQDDTVPTTTAEEDQIFNILDLAAGATPTALPFDYPPGNYTFGDSLHRRL